MWCSTQLVRTSSVVFLLAAGCTDPGKNDDTGPAADTGAGPDTASDTDTSPETDTRRIVGYLPTYRSLDPAGIDLAGLTHLNIAFANPIGAGNEVDFAGAAPADIRALVDAAHAVDVRVLASIGGATGSDAVAERLGPDDVDAFVAELVALVARYDLDGIDVDIEGAAITATYAPFVLLLSEALGDDLLLTAAVASWNGDTIPDAALATYDLLHLMSYDHCGTWSDACEHAPVAAAEADLAYWTVDRGYPADRAVLGVPFYGYCWGPTCPAATLTYAELLTSWPDAATTDWLAGDGYQISHNSPPTLRVKAGIARDYGGVMIWELGQDAAGAESLLRVVEGAL